MIKQLTILDVKMTAKVFCLGTRVVEGHTPRKMFV